MGTAIYRTNSFTELTTGLNRWNGSEWVAASDEIQLTQNGAVASNAQHQVVFAGNINTSGSIDLTMPDGRHLQSQIVGLAYFDEATSKSVMFAQTQDSIGQLLQSSNQVIYTNAFTDFQADVRYTHRRNGFEQDVILRSQPPPPAQYGLNPQTTLLQIWTEYLNAPEPSVSSNQVTAPAPEAKVTGRLSLSDQRIDFGAMQIGRGSAFAIDGQTNQLAAVPVAKQWVHAQGRTFLVEQVLLKSIVQAVQTLPPAPSKGTNSSSGTGSSGASLRLKLPRPHMQAKVRQLMRLAQFDPAAIPGVLVDYDIINESLTNFTFQSDTTYYLGGTVNLYGTTSLEGGAVIKCADDGEATTVVNGNIQCLTAPYRPAIFTATNDNSVGTALASSGSTPTLMVSTFLSCPEGGSISNVRFSYAWNAMSGDGGDIEISDCQFFDCSHAITINADTTNVGLHNVLITMDDSINNTTNFCGCDPGALTIYSEALNIYGENITADLGSQDFMMYFTGVSDPTLTTVSLTNSIMITPNLGAYYAFGGGPVGITPTTNTTFYASSLPAGLFQTVGTASHYLAANSSCLNAGTTNISTNLLADLSQKTTYPPIVFAQAYYSTSSTLFPQAQRDFGTNLSLGYHYDPIDYAFGWVLATNATLSVTPGTVIAGFNTNSGGGYGLAICAGSQFLCTGAPNNLCRVVSYNTVQEPSNTNWNTASLSLLQSDFLGSSPASVVNCRFTDFSIIAQDCNHFYGYFGGSSQTPSFQDCQFHGGTLLSDIGVNLTNCLLERVSSTLVTDAGSSAYVRNCLFWRGNLSLGRHGFSALIQDNLFDLTQISDYGGYTYGYNGFNNTNAAINILSLTNSTDVFMTNMVYQSSWLGNYYQTNTSPLLNKGSTNANLLGLYQYTTQTDQYKQADSIVDIGFHYIAVDSNGNPLDSNNDGIPDYLADANGNGLVDSGEINWSYTSPVDLGLKIVITQPNTNTVVP